MRSLFGIALAASVCLTLVVAGCGGSNGAGLGGDGGQACTTGSCPQGDGGNPTPESGGNGLTCGAPTACGAAGNGRTYEECTQVTPGGQCSAIVYQVSDGHAFTCAGCANCGPVQQQLASYCATAPSGDAGSSSGGDASTGDSSTDADAGSDADAGDDAGGGGTTCLPGVACGSGGLSYEECTTTGRGGACTSIQYEVSNGTSFACASCSDCNSAIQQLDAYCAAENPTTTCTASSPCETSPLTYQTCTTSIGGTCEAVYYQTSDSQTFHCTSCSDCSSALSSLDGYCTQHTPPVTTCGAANACGAGGATYQLCTTTQGGTCESQQYTTSTGQAFSCSACGSCTLALTGLETYCASLTGTGNAVLFGGFSSTGPGLADTWLWNGSTWTAGPSTGPSARGDADGATLGGQLVLFGGTSDTSVTTAYGDTWAWGGTGWTQAATTGPSIRFGAAMATLGSRIVLFGGASTDSATSDLADTWAWSNGVWSQLTPASSPPARVGASAAVLGGKMVVFGGLSAASGYLGDTWTFDGTTWTQESPGTSPAARYYASAATLGGQVILFGGSTGVDNADTWAWNGSTWTQLSPAASPTARSGASATAYDGTIVLFGGSSSGVYQSDTWIWNGSSWASTAATGPQARFGAMMGTL